MTRPRLRTTLLFTLFTAIGLLIAFGILYSGRFRQQSTEVYAPHPLPYGLPQPDRKIFLPVKLNEISGISWLRGTTLACLEDEHGIVFLLDYESGEITGQYRFGKDGDYEDIAVGADGMVYAMRSSGKIYSVDLNEEDQAFEKKFKSLLQTATGAEGLCYDPEANRLLITCKNPNLAGEWKNKKPVYAFDLATEKLLPEPALVLDLAAFKKASGIEINDTAFKPSGIARHPVSGHYYLISAIAKQLLVVDAAGAFVALLPLPRSVFPQPEGICFLPSGDLLIANEGIYGTANLLLFLYKPAAESLISPSSNQNSTPSSLLTTP